LNMQKILLIMGLAGFVVMADNWVVSPILPAIAKDLGITIPQAGILITSYMIPFGLFQLIFGPLADRYGKKLIINTALLLFTVSTFLCAIAQGVGDLSAYRALTGVFAASVMPISLALIGDLFPMEQRQQAIGTFMGISFLGQGVSMALGGSIAYFVSWRGVFLVYAVLALLVAILYYFAGRQINSPGNPNSQFIKPYWELLSHGKTAGTYLTVLLEGIMIVGSFSYFGGFIAKNFNFNYLTIGLIMTGFGVMAVIGGRISGKLANKFGRKNLITNGLILGFLADILLALWGKSLIIVIIAIAAMGLAFMLVHSTLLTIATGFAKMARGAAMSLVAFFFMGGGGVGTSIGARIISATNFEKLFLVYGIGLLVLAFLAKVLVNDLGETKAGM